MVDEDILSSMEVYLDGVHSRIVPIHEWMISDRYAMLQGTAKELVDEMEMEKRRKKNPPLPAPPPPSTAYSRKRLASCRCLISPRR